MDRFEARQGDDGHDRAAEPAADRVKNILIISRDSATLDQITTGLTQRPEFQLTCIASAKFALDQGMIDAHDVVVLDVECEANAVSLVRSIASIQAALICVCGEKSLGSFVKAMGGTVREILVKPILPDEMLDAAERVLRVREQALRLAAKYRKMRDLVRRMVRERRDLNRRVDLVCRDLVEAHRRLTYRVVELQKSHPNHS